jgi:hypothetical protein
MVRAAGEAVSRLFAWCRLAFARLPQTDMSHHRRVRFLLVSMNNHAQPAPAHRLTRSI